MRLKHGGEIRQFSERFQLAETEVVDFSSNINPLGPSASVREIYEASLEELSSYPDPEALEFRREAARHFPLWPENVVAGNGAIELFDLILRFLQPKRALLVEPTFLEYRRFLNVWGAEVRSLSLHEKESFEFHLPQILNALQGVDLFILGHPNNPTGTHLAKEEVGELLREAKRRNIFVVLDEAFVDWAPELSLGREVRDDSFFLVVRSLTKFFSLPGIRIGYGLGARKLVEKLTTYQIPWSCNRLAQKLGAVALRDEEFAVEARRWLLEERDWFEGELRGIPWLKVYPSKTNFLLVHYPYQPGKVLLPQELGRKGFYLRDLTEFPGLGPGYLRLAVRRREENEKLIEALRELEFT